MLQQRQQLAQRLRHGVRDNQGPLHGTDTNSKACAVHIAEAAALVGHAQEAVGFPCPLSSRGSMQMTVVAQQERTACSRAAGSAPGGAAARTRGARPAQTAARRPRRACPGSTAPRPRPPRPHPRTPPPSARGAARCAWQHALRRSSLLMETRVMCTSWDNPCEGTRRSAPRSTVLRARQQKTRTWLSVYAERQTHEAKQDVGLSSPFVKLAAAMDAPGITFCEAPKRALDVAFHHRTVGVLCTARL